MGNIEFYKALLLKSLLLKGNFIFFKECFILDLVNDSLESIALELTTFCTFEHYLMEIKVMFLNGDIGETT